MKILNIFVFSIKIIAIVLITYFFVDVSTSFIFTFLKPYLNSFLPGILIVYAFNVFFILSLLWIIFYTDHKISGSFFQKIKFKKLYCIILIIFIIFNPITSRLFSNFISQSYREYYAEKCDKMLDNFVYENTCYKFKLKYPEGSVFKYANPDIGSFVRFFIPNGKTISGDQENLGVFIKENISTNTDDEAQRLKEYYLKYGPVDLQEFNFGGQKGYRLIFTSGYTSSKKTREISYITIKNNIKYNLNYFPVVDENIKNIDDIVKTFEFTD